MIEVRDLTKRYGDTVAVDGLSFEVRPGIVTGFLGPNGAGKSTTMRILLGLDFPTSGLALVDGCAYGTLDEPLRRVGAVIESDALHPGRSGRNHLRIAARSNGLPAARVDEVLELVGMASVAERRIGTYSLGMRQRLGIAGALLGDPPVLLFDEPVNGLDADGVRWVRHLLRDLAAEGRTVLVSSHLLNEMQHTADHVLVIARGRLIADASTREVLTRSRRHAVRVRGSEPELLFTTLQRLAEEVRRLDDGALLVVGASPLDIGAAARSADVTLSELTEVATSLEDVYLELTADRLDHVSTGAGSSAAP